MTREDFIEQYVLTRASHRRTIEQLLAEGARAWCTIHYPGC